MLYDPLLKESVDELLSKIICHWKLRAAYWALAVRKQIYHVLEEVSVFELSINSKVRYQKFHNVHKPNIPF